MKSALIEQQHSLLLLVDVQEKLAPLCLQQLPWLSNCEWLLRIAQRLNIATMATEQYPKGLGPTVSQLQPYLPNPIPSKVHFSCGADDVCREAILNQQRHQLILIGIETHVCVQQTALNFLQEGLQVFVVADATSSRSQIDHDLALQRMQAQGVQIVTREMVVFEWLRQAGTEEFKMISKEFLR